MPFSTVLLQFVLLASIASAISQSPSKTRSKSWKVEINLPKNCTANKQTKGYELQSCRLPCDVKGPTKFYLGTGAEIKISFKTKPTLVVIGGSQNLQFLNDEIPDMTIQKAPAPPNPIVDHGFTGFTFAPEQKYYSMFKNGVLAKLAIYAFDTSASPGKSATKGLATYKSAACRMFLYVQMTSQPANETVDVDHLFVPKGYDTTKLAARRQLLGKVLPPSLIGGLVVIMVATGCLLTKCGQRMRRMEPSSPA